ncbi:MAG TPA: sodium-dependent transporter, partial [Anaeromyxobacteraceae bacterium]
MPATPNQGRDSFASTLGAFTATVGSAIGLGNIWKFPYLTGSNGGAAFVLTYLLAVALVALPVMVVEHVIGRRMRLDAVRAYRRVVPSQPFWSIIGWAGIASAFLIMAFYTDVAGWVFAYVFKSFGAFVSGRTLDPKTFGALASGTLEPLLWQLAVLVLTASIIASGVSRGIEKVTKTLMPLLFALLLVCDVRALTLPGAAAGVSYLFKPDLSKLSGAVLLSALGLAFFKLSLGMGTMTTYGSYLPDRIRIVPNA